MLPVIVLGSRAGDVGDAFAIGERTGDLHYGTGTAPLDRHTTTRFNGEGFHFHYVDGSCCDFLLLWKFGLLPWTLGTPRLHTQEGQANSKDR